MSDLQLRDAAGKLVANADLSCFDPGQIQASFYDTDGDDLAWFNVSAASARKLAVALLQAADDIEGDGE